MKKILFLLFLFSLNSAAQEYNFKMIDVNNNSSFAIRSAIKRSSHHLIEITYLVDGNSANDSLALEYITKMINMYRGSSVYPQTGYFYLYPENIETSSSCEIDKDQGVPVLKRFLNNQYSHGYYYVAYVKTSNCISLSESMSMERLYGINHLKNNGYREFKIQNSPGEKDKEHDEGDALEYIYVKDQV